MTKITKITRKRRRSQAEIQSEAGPIACFIREQRKSLEYSQEDFALRVGVGLRFLKSLELGKQSVRLDKVNQVLNFLGAQLIPTPINDEDGKP